MDALLAYSHTSGNARTTDSLASFTQAAHSPSLPSHILQYNVSPPGKPPPRAHSCTPEEVDSEDVLRTKGKAACMRFGEGLGRRSKPLAERLRGEVGGGGEDEAAEDRCLRLPPPPPYKCSSWWVRRKRVPHALHRMGLLGGPLRHCGESARSTHTLVRTLAVHFGRSCAVPACTMHTGGGSSAVVSI